MHRAICVIVILSVLSATIHGSCPEHTHCPDEQSIEASSFEFLNKFGPKQYQNLKKLTIVNASINKIAAELKYAKNLEYLDLSDNNVDVNSLPRLLTLQTLKLARNDLKDINLSALPRNIVNLDLSNNLITQLPKDWSFLSDLKILHLYKNLIDCACHNSNIHIYRELINHGIDIPEPIHCSTPKHVAGKDINSVQCSLEDEMINDQPNEEEGSGTDIFNNDEIPEVPLLPEEQVDLDETEIITDNFNVETDIEGSGDEGSGFPMVGCIFNCVEHNTEVIQHSDNDSKLNPHEEMKIIAEDVIQPFLNPKPSTTTEATTITTTTTTTSTTARPTTAKEVEIVKSSVSGVFNEYKTDDLNDTRSGEMEKATAVSHNNYAVYIVAMCGLLLAIMFLICFIKTRKTKRLQKNRRNHQPTLGFGEELKSMDKPTFQSINEKNGSVPENAPLIKDQQNGSGHKPYIPLEHPNQSNGHRDEESEIDEPILRAKDSELLTPTTERVTIRASELPDSIPKTPIVVHRLRNSEGEIVTHVVGQ